MTLNDTARQMETCAADEQDQFLFEVAQWVAAVAGEHHESTSDCGPEHHKTADQPCEVLAQATRVALAWSHQRVAELTGMLEPALDAIGRGCCQKDEADRPATDGAPLRSEQDIYLDQFAAAWWSVANQGDPMPSNWRRHVAMLHSNGVPLRELLGRVNDVCSSDYDQRWCCVDCAFAHVVELCADNLGDLARFGLDKGDRG